MSNHECEACREAPETMTLDEAHKSEFPEHPDPWPPGVRIEDPRDE